MIINLKVLVCCLMITLVVQAQEIDKISEQLTDSTYRYQGIIPPIEFQYNIEELFNTPILNNIPDNILFDKNPSTIWLRTEVLISSSSIQPGLDEVNTHFTSPLYQQYLRDSEFDVVRTILGTVQAGAVGYMAYRHIKRYGFWK